MFEKLKKIRNVRFRVKALYENIGPDVANADEMATLSKIFVKMKNMEPQLLRECVASMTLNEVIQNAGKIKYYNSK